MWHSMRHSETGEIGKWRVETEVKISGYRNEAENCQQHYRCILAAYSLALRVYVPSFQLLVTTFSERVEFRAQYFVATLRYDPLLN